MLTEIIVSVTSTLILALMTYVTRLLIGMNREQRAVATEEFVQERSIA